ncbi:exopolysaccharide biosynthesis polyprenyl glycosylphosphotransferase [Thermus parvatiensis]|uniref:exopolysaccharide biosynthesis polyprenyl glycosylphosphotransferase n=1 Tax=Thermus parvatiensis TaxID=456163 RepID=UPI0030B85F89
MLLPGPRLAKRIIDVGLSLIGGLLLLPFLALIAILIKLDSPGPVLYGHTRIGQNGRRFKAWKFRSMVKDADKVLKEYLEKHPELREEWERDQKLRSDPRVTRIGRILRQTSLDELPQLWNVLRGEMSLVGPRPIVQDEVIKYGEKFALYIKVKPGMTGLWQVSGRNDTTYQERVNLDIYYIRNWSLWLDLYILARTVWVVLTRKGAY